MKKRERIVLPRGAKVPDHVAIIPDGDRRWARARGKTAMEGHKAGTVRMLELARAAREMGIHTVSAWGLSTENWRERPSREVDFLFRRICEQLKKYLAEAKREGVRIVHLGRKDRMPKWFVEEIERVERITGKYDRHVFNIGLDYNGRDEMVRAVNKAVKSSGWGGGEVTRELIEANLDTANQPYPYPDLIIRTSGEQRTSGMLMWQAEYAEFYFEQDNFPDFTVPKFVEAILDYSRRRRRFGGNDAVSHLGFRPEVVARLELAWWRAGRALESASGGGESGLGELIVDHLKEQYGLSKKLAKETAAHLVEALREGRKSRNWGKAGESLSRFYTLIKRELGYAFEPKLVAGLEVRWMKVTEQGKVGVDKLAEVEEAARDLYAEVYRISLLQAAKAAHLRALAAIERGLAMSGIGNAAAHWAKAEDYLVKFYRALKDRVA